MQLVELTWCCLSFPQWFGKWNNWGRKGWSAFPTDVQQGMGLNFVLAQEAELVSRWDWPESCHLAGLLCLRTGGADCWWWFICNEKSLDLSSWEKSLFFCCLFSCCHCFIWLVCKCIWQISSLIREWQFCVDTDHWCSFCPWQLILDPA